MTIIIIGGLIVVGLIVLAMIFTSLYKRSKKEQAFVRTGFGGEKVVFNGGMLVFPILHEISYVNMTTLPIEITRRESEALITLDRMRVDVRTEFYVRVSPHKEGISVAAQTLGDSTLKPEALKRIIEGKMVDVLRSVSASMTMDELHEKRMDFVQKVKEIAAEVLIKNGLELENVSLTSLDQTKAEFLNPENAFDAQGLAKLTQKVKQYEKERNETVQATNLAIQQRNYETQLKSLEIAREEEYAKLTQAQEIAIRRAEQEAEIQRKQSENERQAEEARIVAKRDVELRQIEAKLAREQAEIQNAQAVQIAEQQRAIMVAQKSEEESKAKALADLARAEAIRAEEQAKTVKAEEEAQRQKRTSLIKAEEDAQREATKIRIASEAEKQAAENLASAKLMEAEAEANAQKLRAEAQEVSNRVQADGARALNEAQNLLNAAQINMQIQLAIIQALPAIIRETAKPMENIDSIKIVDFGGNGGLGRSIVDVNGNPISTGAPSLPEQVANSALSYRLQAPLVDSMLETIGIEKGALSDLSTLPQKMLKLNQEVQPEINQGKQEQKVQTGKTVHAKPVKQKAQSATAENVVAESGSPEVSEQ